MLGQDFEKIRKHLKERILYNKQLLGKEKERSQLLELLKKTITNGESNSMLLIGPRGAGKSTLVSSVLSEVESLKNFHKDCIIVKLHGLLHTDDRLALKSITFQMHLDNAIGDKIFGSFAENLAFLLACLKSGEKQTSKSVIFILEEFDLFCAHHNQTLLYNLFDVSQSAHAPICVLGLTCRTDVIQLLEKRVKSRFSHRQMFLYPGPSEDSEKSDLEFALERIKWYLQVPEKEHILGRKEWNNSIEVLVNNKDFQGAVQRLIDLDLNENTLKNILMKCLYNMTGTPITTKEFEHELFLLEQDDMVLILQDLSPLEICLIISMKHHRDIYDNSPMNFEMIYSRYLKFANKHLSTQKVPRPVVMKAFEHIERLELISMVGQGDSRLQKEYQFFKVLVTSLQISEAVAKMKLPTGIVQWANSSLV
ncbi:origin recognition complex subunit 4 [Euwallacea fornicatus]|uniref:origin recognition complex subunit 4 n=1 Tax=Euwallacea fornicatus TaxID=995702 RepID=UPI00338E913A